MSDVSRIIGNVYDLGKVAYMFDYFMKNSTVTSDSDVEENSIIRDKLSKHTLGYRRLKSDCVSEFSGNTYEIPLTDLPQIYDENKFVFIGSDILLQKEFIESVADPMKWSKEDRRVGQSFFRYSFEVERLWDRLKSVYTNSSVVNREVTGDVLQGVLDYVQSSTDIDILVFNGIEESLNSGVSETQVLEKLHEIDSVCSELGTRAVYVHTNVNNSDTVSNILSLEQFSFDIINVNDIVLYRAVNDDWGMYPALVEYTDGSKHYADFVLHRVDDIVSELAFTDVVRDCYYITLFHTAVNKDEFSNNSYDVAVSSEQGVINRKYSSYLGKRAQQETRPGTGTTCTEALVMYTDGKNVRKYSSQYRNNIMNVKTTYTNTGYDVKILGGDILAIEVSRHFDYATPQPFLGQSTTLECASVARATSKNTLQGLIGTRHYRNGGYPNKAQEVGFVSSHVYPYAGTSWITTSDDDYEYFHLDEDMRGLDFYITFTDGCFSLSCVMTNVPEQLDNPIDMAAQSVSFGLMQGETPDNHYSIFCAGGSSALAEDIMTYTPVSTNARLTYHNGNVYNLSMLNPNMSNSNILYTTKANSSSENIESPSKVLYPDGTYKNVFTLMQSQSHVAYPVRSGTPPDHAVYLSSVSEIDPSKDKFSSRMSNATKENLQCLDVSSGEYDYDFDADSTVTTDLRMLPLSLVVDDDSSRGETYHQHYIAGVYKALRTDLDYGEIVADSGKKYLCLPNGYSDRLFTYPLHIGIVNSLWGYRDIVEDFEKYDYEKSDYKIKGRLLIDLGDVNV